MRQAQSAKANAAKIRRSRVRAPRDGEVQDLAVFGIGAVIQPGEKVASIVPVSNEAYIECALAPSSVDEVFEGQHAFVTFYSLGNVRRNTLAGTVTRISPSASISRDGMRYFSVDIQLNDDEHAKLGETLLLSGMSADVQIATAPKTMLTYLVDPLLKQFANALN